MKVKKNDWDTIMEAFHQAVSRNYLLENYETKLVYLEKRTTDLIDQVEKLKQFVTLKGLGERFQKYLKSLAPKSLKQKLEEAKREAMRQNRQKKIRQQDLQKEDTYWRL